MQNFLFVNMLAKRYYVNKNVAFNYISAVIKLRSSSLFSFLLYRQNISYLLNGEVFVPSTIHCVDQCYLPAGKSV